MFSGNTMVSGKFSFGFVLEVSGAPFARGAPYDVLELFSEIGFVAESQIESDVADWNIRVILKEFLGFLHP